MFEIQMYDLLPKGILIIFHRKPLDHCYPVYYVWFARSHFPKVGEPLDWLNSLPKAL